MSSPEYLTESEAESLYDQVLRDVYGENVNICGLKYDTVYTLKEVDYTAYRCGLHDYCESQNIEII
jgi:hypothetical protein